jgi:hypothetical protein
VRKLQQDAQRSNFGVPVRSTTVQSRNNMSTMAITAADVNKLRQITGAGMMDCKKALTEANGDFDAAIDVLRKQGQKVAAKRADRDATEGLVIAKTSADGTRVSWSA